MNMQNFVDRIKRLFSPQPEPAVAEEIPTQMSYEEFLHIAIGFREVLHHQLMNESSPTYLLSINFHGEPETRSVHLFYDSAVEQKAAVNRLNSLVESQFISLDAYDKALEPVTALIDRASVSSILAHGPNRACVFWHLRKSKEVTRTFIEAVSARFYASYSWGFSRAQLSEKTCEAYVGRFAIESGLTIIDNRWPFPLQSEDNNVATDGE